MVLKYGAYVSAQFVAIFVCDCDFVAACNALVLIRNCVGDVGGAVVVKSRVSLPHIISASHAFG